MTNWRSQIITLIVSLSVMLAVWHLTVVYLKVPAYILPSPVAVGMSLYRGLVIGTFYPSIASTVLGLLIGYVIGAAFGLLMAIAFVESKIIETIFNPYVVALQAVPKVAIAPLLVIWVGYGLGAKVTMVALIVFFPVFVNAIVGMRATDPDRLSLFDAFSASRLSKLINLKLPSAAGAIFAGLQVSIVFALIGAIVTEFVASSVGVGVIITASMASFDVPTMFAGLIVVSVIGVALNAIVEAVHKRVVFWEGATR